ncbi:MAG: hypothetical protein AB1595_00425, partial [bacterium]
PVLFTEIGFASIDGASIKPWALEDKARVDCDEQALCYEATFQATKERDWVYGMYWWHWEEKDDPSGFTPFKKVAEKVIADWYKCLP